MKAVARKYVIYPYDYIVIGYCLLMIGLILIFGRPLPEYFDELTFFASMAAIAALIIRFTDENKNRLHALIRLVYPAFMYGLFYTWTAGLMFLMFDQFYDWQLTAFEKAIFGVNPTLYIDQHLLNTWANEIFSACYFLYYPMLPVCAGTVFIKRDYHVLKPLAMAASLTFFLSYLLFSLYPIEGPRWHFADVFVNAIEGPIFRPMVEYVIQNGAVRGGCMPSSHVAVALVIMMFCFKYYRKVGWFLLPINIGLAIGTFWGRFHYVSDVVVGAAIGAGAVLFTWKYYERTGRPLGKTVTDTGREQVEESIETDFKYAP